VGEKIDNIVSGVHGDFYKKDMPAHGEVSYKSSEEYKVFEMESYPITGSRKGGSWKGLSQECSGDEGEGGGEPPER